MLLEKVKVALRVTSIQYDGELMDLIAAALADIGITDVKPDLLEYHEAASVDPLIQRAVITYCKMNFGTMTLTSDQYARLKSSYDEQKKQMLMNSNYTDWGVQNA